MKGFLLDVLATAVGVLVGVALFAILLTLVTGAILG